MACHGDTGVKPGGVRGGVAVAIPLERYEALSRATSGTLVASHGAVWLLGVAGIWGVGRRAERRHRVREQARKPCSG